MDLVEKQFSILYLKKKSVLAMKISLCFVFENNSVSKIHCQWYCVCLSIDIFLKVSEVAQIFIEAPFHLL